MGGLFAFGLLGIFSIGLPLLLLGIALVVASPFRSRPRVLWAIIGGVACFIVVFVLAAPLGCTSSATASGSSKDSGIARITTHGPTECANLLGIPYAGGMNYSPPYLPAVLAGLAGAAVWVAGAGPAHHVFTFRSGRPRGGAGRPARGPERGRAPP